MSILATYVNSVTNHKYHVISSQSWTDAEAEAVALGGHLVTINDEVENSWISTTVVDSFGSIWIGLNDVSNEGQLQWTSGEAYTYTGLAGLNYSDYDVCYMYYYDNDWYFSGNYYYKYGLVEVTRIIGTVGNDSLMGTSGGVEMLGLAGNDVINALEGDDFLYGNEGHDTLNGGLGADYMEGGTGNDLYFVNNVGDIVVEKRAEGTDTVQSSLSWTLGDHIEKLVLIANYDVFGADNTNGFGNALDNTITGNSGNNTLDGRGGRDTMVGGLGNDSYVVNTTDDIVVETGNAGVDTVKSGITWTLGSHLENLQLIGTSAIHGTGNSLNNVLRGNGAANTLSGGGGNDTLMGGAGGDTYIVIVDSATVTIVEGINAGSDTVISSVHWTLGANIENLTLAGTNEINGVGNALNNTLTGNSAANVLGGGEGVDTMLGGGGNDVYAVDNSGDVIGEEVNGGIDAVQSSVTYSLSANIENITLIGLGAVNASGNGLANFMTGNSANNVLNGGSGADTLVGGLGADTYVVDNIDDHVVENASSGVDSVRSSITWTLGDNVEKLILTGSLSINGFGNVLANTMTGNSASNTLDGGIGADSMAGGIGDDTFVVDNVGDVVIENQNAGIDSIQSSVTCTLAANVENLTLTGSTAVDGFGNDAANVITGNSANNTLRGSLGADTLIGGGGANRFYFHSIAECSDTITDFATLSDTIVFNSANFGFLPLGSLAETRFVSNSTGVATGTEHRFIFNTTSHELLYDPDGSGTVGASTTIAILNLSTLSATDIVMAS